jgi:hypothetical protein
MGRIRPIFGVWPHNSCGLSFKSPIPFFCSKILRHFFITKFCQNLKGLTFRGYFHVAKLEKNETKLNFQFFSHS